MQCYGYRFDVNEKVHSATTNPSRLAHLCPRNRTPYMPSPILWFVRYVFHAPVNQMSLCSQHSSGQFPHDLVVIRTLANGALLAPALTMRDQRGCGFKLAETAWAD